ncbi:phosphatidylcholine/phosphatidylserine synthase [Acidisoma cellulosilytica]|uniref:Phosphatidylcholine/phosphatidylserine synthase n=1 Tax=Acidisoma cellulosilyticum TaxID=2802395 RepID=A0A963Z036_9PROT|nr:phosphatidylcholine/phosphatidylserine synthase [Acidisoma cellulosilyticum]
MWPVRRRRRLKRPAHRPRYKGPSFNRVLPNVLTMLGLCAGLTGIRFSLDGQFDAAVIAIAVAAVIDGLDGRIARLLKGTSRFGAEFDSLADFLCFGIAPAFLLYLWSLHRFGGVGFIPSLMFAVCMALRLARFNAALDSTSAPKYTAGFFTGVPAPAGALLALFPIFVGLEARVLNLQWLDTLSHAPAAVALVLIGTGLLLVSTLPVWSFKNFKVPAPAVLPILLGTGVYAAFMLAEPWAALALAGMIYVGMLPFSTRSFRRLRDEAEAMRMGEETDETESNAA